MDNLLTTAQVSRLTSVPRPTIIDGIQRNVRPHLIGNSSQSHAWTRVQCLAIGVGQVLRGMGMRGGPVDNAIQLVASYSEQELEMVMESRPVLCVLPGVAVVSQLVTRDFIQQEAPNYFNDFGVTPLGIDLEKMWNRLNQQIAEYEKNGWEKQGVA